ncbi:MAG: VOC family protein, partial [Acidimicrobiia bacterium]
SPWLPGVRDDEQLLSIAITTTDAKALFVQYQDAGVDFQERLREKLWNAIEFVVRDPDGNLILFGSQT